MKRIPVTSAIILVLVLATGPASAQDSPWIVEVRVGGSAPTESFAGTDLKAGVGLEGTIGYRILPNLTLYGGWDWQHRQAKELLFGVGEDVEDTGYSFGLRYVVPGNARAKPFLRIGGLYKHVEIEADDGSLIADSKHTGRGWEVGGGLDVRLTDSWSLTPGVRYRRFEPTVRVGGVETSTTLAYLVFDAGIALKF